MSFDGEEHETRRNVLLAAGLSVMAVVLVGGMFWLMSSLTRPAVTGTAAGVKATSAAPTTSGAPAPTSTTTTFVPPSPTGTWTATSTATLPPPEQPTVTAPVVTPTVVATSSAPPAPRTTQPTVTQAPPVTPSPAPTPPPPSRTPTPTPTSAPAPPAAPSVTNVNLKCSKDAGKKISGQLSFTTTTRIDVLLGAGGSIQRQQAGPGNVTLTATGRGAEVCFAQVAGQTVGPIQAG